MVLKVQFVAEHFKEMAQCRVLIIGIGPWQHVIGFFLIEQGEIGVNAVPQVNPVNVVFARCQNQSFCGEESRIDIDPSLAIVGKHPFQLIGEDFDVGQTFRVDQMQKTAHLAH